MMGDWGYGSGYMHNAGYAGFGGIISLIFWIIIIVLIVWAVKSLARGGSFHDGPMMHHGIPKEDSALAILRERYAKGEINKEEFESRKKDLMVK